MYISVCNQKGGIGKTTYTVLLASWLHYELGKRVMVLDCDFPQWSIVESRKREISILEKNESYKVMMMRQFDQCKQKMWPVLNSTPDMAIETVENYLEQSEHPYDVVLFDLPGTISTKGVISTISAMDHVFVPMKADKLVMESTVSFAQMVYHNLVLNNDAPIKGLHLFWTMIDRREKTVLYEQYEQVLDFFGLDRLATRIPYRSKFSKEILLEGGAIYRSTIFPPGRAFVRDCQLDALGKEILSIIKIPYDGQP